jgi:8-hydroxy-5-deazaflavin:NADPH oxidoreductase
VAEARFRLGILGGTGPLGSGLALRWARAGHQVSLGSRDEAKSRQVAQDLNARLVAPAVASTSNEAAARECEVAVLTVPYAAQLATALSVCTHLKGKVLVDVTVPLVPPKVSVVQLPPEGSCVLALQRQLGADVRVVSAFQNISAQHLHDLDHDIDCDVLVCGDDSEACETVVALAGDLGTRGWRAGTLANSVVAEALTSVLISINRRYKIAGSGLRITGTPAKPRE